jgi:hypothetical protein
MLFVILVCFALLCHSSFFLFTMDCLTSQPSPPSNTRMHWSTNHTDDRLDDAVEQLLRIYNARDSALPRPSQHQHHRNISVDLGNAHRRSTHTYRASTSWLSANAGFEQEIYRVKETTTTKVATKNNIEYTPPASPKHSPKSRRVVTFEDQVVKDTRLTTPTPPASPTIEDKMVSRDNAAHRQNRFFALLHVETPKILSKRSAIR